MLGSQAGSQLMSTLASIINVAYSFRKLAFVQLIIPNFARSVGSVGLRTKCLCGRLEFGIIV
jgi:hypothetical protein